MNSKLSKLVDSGYRIANIEEELNSTRKLSKNELYGGSLKMKKIIMVSMIALIAAFGFVGCSEGDESLADLKWKNEAGDAVQDIKWISGGKVDQSWDGTTADLAETSFKGIGELAGTADCLDSGGDAATIALTTTGSTGYSSLIDGSSAATIQENAAAVLVIDVVTKK